MFIALYLSCEIDNNENIVPTEKNSDNSLIVIYNNEKISPDENNFTILLMVEVNLDNVGFTLEVSKGATLLETIPANSLTSIPASDYPINSNAGKAYRWHSTSLGGVFNKDFIVITEVDLYAQEVSASFEMIIENRIIPTDLFNYGKMSKGIFSNYTSGAMVVARYVKKAVSGTGNGSSWDNANKDIQAVIDGVNDADADKIYVIMIISKPMKRGGLHRKFSAYLPHSLRLYFYSKFSIF